MPGSVEFASATLKVMPLSDGIVVDIKKEYFKILSTTNG
jgi:hypothetical protein